tara:strand:- start:33 stop:197 length:165 start_codon:yes stop_codon:yes gene_type:complete
MSLYEKIIALYPELAEYDFADGDIILQDNSDGKGAFIREWNHPTLAKPTDEELT